MSKNAKLFEDENNESNGGKYHKGNSLNDLTGRDWVKFTKSWFICNPLPRSEDEILHPAKFPEELVESFIKFFTKKGQIVFDPFLGTGSTLVAAASAGRSGAGIELATHFHKISKSRIDKLLPQVRGSAQLMELAGEKTNKIELQAIHGDSRNLVNLLSEAGISQVDYCITSPPYWNMLRTSRGGVESAQKKRAKEGLVQYYSDDSSDVGNINDYEEFIEALREIFVEVYKVLKPSGYLTVIIQNILTDQGEMKPLAWDLARALSSDYILKQERLWCQDNKQLGIWGYPKSYVSNVHHHYCLIFQKKSVIDEAPLPDQ